MNTTDTTELMDVELISLSGDTAIVNVIVYSPYMKMAVELRCQYAARLGLALMDQWPSNLDAVVFALTDPSVMDEVKEVVMYQRDLNREKN